MLTYTDLLQQIPIIEERLGYVFQNPNLLLLAFVHRSYINEQRVIHEHNERLEFLGDSVLGLVVSDHLYRTYPERPEGELSALRSRIIDASSCNRYLHVLQVDHYLLLGKGERLNDGRGRETILADLFEALVGAIYLDGGFAAAQTFILERLKVEMQQIAVSPTQNWKAILQDYCQRSFQLHPEYVVLSETGPDHSKVFLVRVQLHDRELGRGEGSSKKIAQQAAAGDAVRRLNIEDSV